MSIEVDRMIGGQYYTVFNTVQDALFLVEVKGPDTFCYVETNLSHQKATGISLEAIRGKTPQQLLGEELGEKIAANYRRCIHQKEPLSYQETLDLPGGKRTWFTRLKHVSEGEGLGYLVGSSIDITEIKQTQRELKRERKRLAHIIEGTESGTWEWNVQTGETIFNEQWAHIIGYSLAELRPFSIKTWEKFVHPDDLKKSGEALQAHFSGASGLYEIEVRMRHKRGYWVWVLDRGKVLEWDDQGKPLWMYGTHTDISERKKSLQRLERFRIALDNSADQIFLIDPDKMIFVDVNQTACLVLGYSRSELLAMGPHDIKPHFNRKALHARFRQILDQGSKHAIIQTVHRCKDGTDMDVEVNLRTMQTANDNNLIAIARDVSERKKQELELVNKERYAAYQRSQLAKLVQSKSMVQGQMQEAMQSITKTLARTLNIARCSIWEMSQDKERLVCLDEYQLDTQKHQRGMVLEAAQFSRYLQVVEKDQFLSIHDVYRDERTAELTDEYFRPAGVRSLMDVGIFIEGCFFGVICCEHVGEQREWSIEDEMFLRTIGAISAQFFENMVRRETEKKLIRQNAFQRLIATISSDFIRSKRHNMRFAVERMLRKTGRFFNVDCSYLFLFSADHSQMSNTHEWCRRGIHSQKHSVKDFSLDALPWWKQKVMNREIVHSPDVAMLPERVRAEIEEFRGRQILSLLTVPVYHKDLLIGFYGFDAVRQKRNWGIHEITYLRVLANILADSFVRIAAEKELVAAREEALFAKDEALAASRAKSEFLANMSHEIRTPLNGVIGFTELARNNTKDDSQRKYLENAHVASHMLMGILNDILDFSKIESGKKELDPVKTDLTALVAQTVSVLSHRAAAKDLDLDSCLARGLPDTVMVDPVRLKQILVNLLDNAIKFTERGKVSLLLDVEPLSEGWARFCFKVKDTGIGISKSQQKKLFQAFMQADSSTTRNFGGSGLGLAISQLLAEKMDSSIQIDSEPGKGSTFSFVLDLPCEYGEKSKSKEIGKAEQQELFPSPAYPHQSRETETDSRKVNHFPSGPVILVAEDVKMNLELIRLMLKQWIPDAEILEAGNGKEAVELVKKGTLPDLILMDIQMPKMDGLEATRILRAMETKSGEYVPIVALTAGVLKAEKEKCIKAGMDGFLGKPLDRNQLGEVLTQFLSDPGEASTSQISGQKDQMAVFDLDAVLQQTGASKDEIVQLAGRAVLQVEKYLKEIEEAHESGDPSKMMRSVHTLKGLGFNVGFYALANEAVRMEQEVKERPDTAGEYMRRLRQEFRRILSDTILNPQAVADK